MRTKKFVEILGQKITEQNNKIVMLENKVRELEKQVENKDWICSMRVHALRKVLEEHTVKIVTELNGQEITTKMIRDKRKELAVKKLECALKAANEALEKLCEEEA